MRKVCMTETAIRSGKDSELRTYRLIAKFGTPATKQPAKKTILKTKTKKKSRRLARIPQKNQKMKAKNKKKTGLGTTQQTLQMYILN